MNIFSDILSELENSGNLRILPSNLPEESAFVDFTSNDYLGLSTRWKSFLPEFTRRFGDYGFSSSASRLLSSRQEIFSRLENYLENLYNKPCLLFNSGYHANVGIVSALASLPDSIMVCDKLVHASVIDGLKMSGREFRRFPHNDIFALEKILRKESEKYNNIFVVAESVYSMEGDTAPLAELVEIKKRYGAVKLYVDEAHAFGVFGSKGLGLSEENGLIQDIDIIVGTFGKAAASVGAFTVVNPEVKDFLINRSRSLIFSTALPPVNIAWSLLMTEILSEMTKERKSLKIISKSFREGIEEITGSPCSSRSQIVPLVTGDSKKAITLASLLRENYNIFALPVRRPTVPPGKECIRFSLKSGIGLENKDFLNSLLSDIQEAYSKVFNNEY